MEKNKTELSAFVRSDHKMANGNRTGFFLDGLRRSSPLESDVFGLDLKMQPIQSSSSSSYSYPCKRNTLTAPPPPLLPPPQQPSSGFTVFNGDDEGGISGGGGNGPSFCNTSYKVSSSLSDIYYVAGLGDALSSRTVLPLNSGEGMALFSRASVFTASQRQELERQTIICKYMMASLPVPPQLLLPLPNNHFPAPLHQSSTAASAMELRFSSRSDPEPWRCRRTDGKKWRCSKNVAHGQKYCERHAHKSRSRSRKLVEIQTKLAPPPAEENHSYNNLPISNTITQQIPHLPSSSIGSMAASCHPTSEGSGGTMPFWACNQQWQQQQTMDLSRSDNVEPTKEKGCSVQLVQNRDNQHRISKMGFLSPSILKRGFVDAWSTADKVDGKKKTGKKIPISSLTLSIPGGENEDEDDDLKQGQGGNPTVGTMIRLLERNKKDANQWINAVTGMNSAGGGGTLGGPLGEALCLGIASNNSSISTTTSTTSGCSRSSGEDAWW